MPITTINIPAETKPDDTRTPTRHPQAYLTATATNGSYLNEAVPKHDKSSQERSGKDSIHSSN